MRIIFFVIFLVSLLAVGFGILRLEMRTNLTLNQRMAKLMDSISSIGSGFKHSLSVIKLKDDSPGTGPKAVESASGQKIEAVSLYLKHGGVMSGKLIKMTDSEYTIEWGDQPFTIDASKVSRVEYKTQKDIEWSYKNDVVIRRTNGVVLDGTIVEVTDDLVTILYSESEGSAEVGIKRNDIEYLMFAPVCNKESETQDELLRKQFPKMKFYKEGNVTIITDSHETWVGKYKNIIRRAYTEIYLKYFVLLKGRQPSFQNFVVIFDNYVDYAEYSITDGVPFWAVVGYFNPSDKTLFLFNAFGEKMEELIFEAIVGRTGKAVKQSVDEIKKMVDQRYHIFIDGQVKEFKDRYWNAYSFYKDGLIQMTTTTLRHEFTHEVFHNWKLQSVIVSKVNINKEELAKKKREFLETDDYKKKETLLLEMLNLRKDEFEKYDAEAANSWLVEGIATYCETDPIGGISEERLYRYEEMAKKNELNPIEFLAAFELGSFPGICQQAAINAYAQSWALVSFLMSKYPDQFMAYMKRMADESPSESEQLSWLLESLGMDLPRLEEEYKAYMSTYPAVEDPYVVQYTKWLKIWKD